MTTIQNCKTINLSKIKAGGGYLTSVQKNHPIPFSIARVYYIYDVPDNQMRGGHAHKELEVLMIAVRGSFNVILGDGQEKKKVKLNKPNCGLYIPKLIWRELDSFSEGSICLVLASHTYEEMELIRKYDSFVNYKQLGTRKKLK
jgi:hypothetical protein